jgi:hypothetical protein
VQVISATSSRMVRKSFAAVATLAALKLWQQHWHE